MSRKAGLRNAVFNEVVCHKQTGSLRLTDSGIIFYRERDAGDDSASQSRWAWSIIHKHSVDRNAPKLKLQLDDGTLAAFTFSSQGDVERAERDVRSHLQAVQGQSTELGNDEQQKRLRVPCASAVPARSPAFGEESTAFTTVDESAAFTMVDEPVTTFSKPGSHRREDQADMDAKQAVAGNPQEKASSHDGIGLHQRVATAAMDPVEPAHLGDVEVQGGDHADTTRDPAMWAISCQQLMELEETARNVLGKHVCARATMRGISRFIMEPACRKNGTSHALGLNPAGLKLDAFVAHAWDDPFADFVEVCILFAWPTSVLGIR